MGFIGKASLAGNRWGGKLLFICTQYQLFLLPKNAFARLNPNRNPTHDPRVSQLQIDAQDVNLQRQSIEQIGDVHLI
jgi:hypothetical protein